MRDFCVTCFLMLGYQQTTVSKFKIKMWIYLFTLIYPVILLNEFANLFFEYTTTQVWRKKPRTEAVMLGILSVLLFCHANCCFRLWILCELLIVKYSVSICSFLVFDVTLEVCHSWNWNARAQAEEGAAVSGLGIATPGGHIPNLFLLHFQFAVGRIRRASTKRQIIGDRTKYCGRAQSINGKCWGGAMEVCPEGGVRSDEYLSSFNLCSFTVWRHNIQNEVTDCDSFGANPEFCFSQSKALLGSEVCLCKAVWKPRAATSFCEPVCDLKLETQEPIALSCSMTQTLLPLGSAASPVLTPFTLLTVWLIGE